MAARIVHLQDVVLLGILAWFLCGYLACLVQSLLLYYGWMRKAACFWNGSLLLSGPLIFLVAIPVGLIFAACTAVDWAQERYPVLACNQDKTASLAEERAARQEVQKGGVKQGEDLPIPHQGGQG